MSNPKKSRQEPRRLKTRAALMQAGAELLSERPIDAIPVDDIVESAGVAKGSFFNHFQDKADFAAAIAAEIRAEVEVQVTAANDGVSDPARRIARAVAGYAQFTRLEPRRARIMLRGHEWTALADHPLNSGLRADVESGLASKVLTSSSISSAVIFVGGAAHMLLVALLGASLMPAEIRRTTAELLILVLTGLGLEREQASVIAAEATREVIPD